MGRWRRVLLSRARNCIDTGHAEALVRATKAEAATFTLINGERGGYVFFREDDQARLLQFVEPLYAALDAAIEIVPVLTLDDLKRDLPRYNQRSGLRTLPVVIAGRAADAPAARVDPAIHLSGNTAFFQDGYAGQARV